MLTRTTTALLDDLTDATNEDAWRELDDRYRPVLVGFARRLGLSEVDAADAAQEALAEFVRAYRRGKYDRGRGRLRSWIIGIARHCILDEQRAQATRRERRGLSALGQVPGDDELAEIWDAECEREILRRALFRLHGETSIEPHTLEAFEQVAFQQRSAAEVATDLQMTLNDVYLAKHRCLKRLREFVDEITSAFDEDA
jgi:RNA polymerase sigma-70 factor (ECF subfamily)